MASKDMKPSTEGYAQPLLAEPAQPLEPAEKPRASFRDGWAALLLFVNIGALVFCAVKYGPDSFHADGELHFATNTLFSTSIGVAVLAGVLSALCVAVMMRFAGAMITFTFYVKIAVWTLIVVLILATGNVGAVFLPLVILAITLCYWRLVRNRIPFAAANLTTACLALTDHVAVFCVAFSALVVSLGFIALWIVAAVGAVTHTLTGDCDGGDDAAAVAADDATLDDGADACRVNSGVCVWLFISLLWGLQTIRYVVHITAAGTVAGWWFAGPEAAASPVAGSLARASTTSLGSASLAALILAILETLKQMAHAARRGGGRNAGCACFAECILGCIESIMRYFNKWALTYCGIYGDSFWGAGKSVLNLFSNAGWTAIINDDLIDNTLYFACLIVGALTAAAGGLIALAGSLKSSQTWTLVLIGLFSGYYCAAIVMSVIQSGVCTCFVCFCEDAAALRRTRPEAFQALELGWRAFHPELLVIVLGSAASGAAMI